jgi:hypothetical protein
MEWQQRNSFAHPDNVVADKELGLSKAKAKAKR